MKRLFALTSAIALGAGLVFACADDYGAEDGDSPRPQDDDASTAVLGDAASDRDGAAPVVGACGHDQAFGPSELVAELGEGNVLGARLGPNELSIFYGRAEPGRTDRDLYVAHRTKPDASFGTPVKIAELSTDLDENKPTFPKSLARIYFHRVIGTPSWGIFVATRDLGGTTYGPAAPLDAGINLPGIVQDPFVTADEKELWFTARYDAPDGGTSLPAYLRRITGPGDGTFGAPEIVQVGGQPVNGSNPVLSADGLALYFSAIPAGGAPGDSAIHVATRGSLGAPFGPARRIAELDVPDMRDEPSYVSADACTLYFFTNRNARFEVHRASRRR